MAGGRESVGGRGEKGEGRGEGVSQLLLIWRGSVV